MMNSSKSEASMSATSGSNDLSRMAKELTNEMATVVGGFQNEARAAQIIELTSALEDAMKKKRKTEEDAASQIKRLEAHLKLKIEDKADADQQVVDLLTEQARLENIINQDCLHQKQIICHPFTFHQIILDQSSLGSF